MDKKGTKINNRMNHLLIHYPKNWYYPCWVYSIGP